MADATNNKGAPASAGLQQNPAPIPFGQRPAYPQQIRVGDLVGVDAPGLNIRQHAWLHLLAGALAGASDVTYQVAESFADSHIDNVLERLEGLA